jgi:hypothetical protein
MRLIKYSVRDSIVRLMRYKQINSTGVQRAVEELDAIGFQIYFILISIHFYKYNI